MIWFEGLKRMNLVFLSGAVITDLYLFTLCVLILSTLANLVFFFPFYFTTLVFTVNFTVLLKHETFCFLKVSFWSCLKNTDHSDPSLPMKHRRKVFHHKVCILKQHTSSVILYSACFLSFRFARASLKSKNLESNLHYIYLPL